MVQNPGFTNLNIYRHQNFMKKNRNARKSSSDFIRIMKMKAGQPPGYLEFALQEDTEKTTIRRISYNESSYENVEVDNVASLENLKKTEMVHWIQVVGLKDIELLEKLALTFNIDVLIMEDVLNPEHIPKSEENDEHLFFTLNILIPKNGNEHVEKNHISFVLAENYLISFQQKSNDIFDTFIKRIEKAVGKVRFRKSDYLLYRLVDIIVDNYYLLFEHVEAGLDEIEDALINDQAADMVKQIQQEKKELSFLRRNIFPVNETIRSVVKIEGKYIRKGTFRYFVDTQDHLIHLVQSLELYRETIANLMELQMANNSNRMNSVMKTLTIISTVFIPLTFLAGVYGMNFKYMPELEIPWAYPALLIFMTFLGFGMFIYMKRRKWF